MHRGSFHPKHVFRGVLKSQLLRFNRICTRQEDRDRAVGTLFQTLQQRGDSRSFLQTVFFTVISAYMRSPNLKELLVRAQLKAPMAHMGLPMVQKIARNRTLGTTYALTQNISWNQANCIYLIQCKRCPVQYVGETRNTLRARFAHHTYNVRRGHKADTHLVKHFQRHGPRNMCLRGLEHNPHWTTFQRRRREEQWIKKLDTTFSNGLNEKTNTSGARSPGGTGTPLTRGPGRRTAGLLYKDYRHSSLLELNHVW